jgi:2',3'-cyclic-nucleotide 2'-phosphodiesterase (5'-nucleotidase family)
MKRVAAALALLLAACPAKTETPDAPAPPANTKKLILLATGDVGSDTDVCGCKAHPLGGIVQRAKIVADRGPKALVLDAGDLYFRNWSVAPRYAPQATETAQFLADSQKMMGVPAMAVGERDLAMGLSFLRGLEKRSGARQLAANLVHAKSSTAAFEAFTIVEREGLKIGIVGAAPELPKAAPAHQVYAENGLETIELGEALTKASAAAKAGGATLIVGLLHVGQTRAMEVLSALPEGTIDLAFVSGDRLGMNLQVLAGGKSAMFQPGDRGKFVASVELELLPGAKLFVDQGAVEAEKKQIKALDERLEIYAREDAGTANAGDRVATISRLGKRRAELIAELAQISGNDRHRISGRLLEVSPSAPADEAMAARYRAYQTRLQVVNAGEPTPNRAEINYVGAAGCKTCHEPAFAQWKTTGHAKAWATMVQTRQVANLDCIPCHVTGFDRPGGPQNTVGLEAFVDVGCESCHGPGSAHVANPKIELDYARNVPEKVCAECHRAQADQKPFDFEERLPKVLGKGHGVKLGKR